jgi:ribosomal-protein-alanine N-acetyltransferase
VPDRRPSSDPGARSLPARTADLAAGEPIVHLRPFAEAEVELLVRFTADPAVSAPYEWFGFRSPEGHRRRWRADCFLESDPHLLVVADHMDAPLGWASWRHGVVAAREWVWEIGALLFPEHRGKGMGTTAHRLLVDHLFATTTAHRLSASTAVENVAGQRALERCGFAREGLVRQPLARGGRCQDSFIYGLLRAEPVPGS